MLDTDCGRLDILQLVQPDIGYADLIDAAIPVEVFGHQIRVCCYDDLVAMKTAADRDVDRLDLKRLDEAQG